MRQLLLISVNILILVASSIFPTCAYCQESFIQAVLEEMATSAEDDNDGLTEDELEQAAEAFESIEDINLNLNTATREDLESLYFLTPEQISDLLKYRKSIDEILTYEELELVSDFTYHDIEILKNYTYLGDKPLNDSLHIWKQDLTARVSRTFPTAKGYISNDSTIAYYIGAPYKELLRVRGKIDDNYEYAIVAENDAGEPMFSHGTTLTDFTSGFIYFQPKKSIVKKLIIGHYLAQAGQGLGLWTGFKSDVSSVQNSIDSRSRGIFPTTSASEYNYLRGIAVELRKYMFKLDLFASHIDCDATLYYNADSSVYITGITTSGYHRTTSERSKRNNLQQQFYGGYLVYSYGNFKAGIGYNFSHLSHPFGEGSNLYQYYLPQGKNFSTIHADYHCYLSRYLLYGEIVYQDSKTLAGMQGVDVSLGHGNSFTVAYRNFGKKYYALNQSPSSINSQPASESGLYASLALHPFKYFDLRTYINIFEHSWLTSASKYSPSQGLKATVTASYTIDKDDDRQVSHVLTFRFRHENREKYSGKEPYAYKKTNYRLQYTGYAHRFLRFLTTLEHVHYEAQGEKSNGYYISQEAKYTFRKPAINLTARIAHFDTDDYNSRVYNYQPDVSGSISMPTASGNGLNALLNVKWNIYKGISFWLCGNYTKYFDRDEISSGNNLISSSQKFDVKAQLQIKLWKVCRNL